MPDLVKGYDIRSKTKAVTCGTGINGLKKKNQKWGGEMAYMYMYSEHIHVLNVIVIKKILFCSITQRKQQNVFQTTKMATRLLHMVPACIETANCYVTILHLPPKK